MIEEKQLATLRKQLADNKFKAVITKLLSVTEEAKWGELHAEAVMLSSQLEAYEKEERGQTASRAELRQSKNQLCASLLGVIDEIEEEIATAEAESKSGKEPVMRTQGVSENKLKRHIFVLLLLIKGLIILFVLTLWQSGSNFTQEQFIGTLGVIIPIFATYLGLMLTEKLATRNQLSTTDDFVSKGFRWTVYLLLIAYGFSFFVVLNLKGPGVIDHKQMMALLTLIESGLGVYVGRVVISLFHVSES